MIAYKGINISYFSLFKILFSFLIFLLVFYTIIFDNFIIKNDMRKINDIDEVIRSSSAGINPSVKKVLSMIGAAVGLTSSVVTIHQYVKQEMTGYNKALEAKTKELEEANIVNAVQKQKLEFYKSHKLIIDDNLNRLDFIKVESERLISEKDRLLMRLCFVKDSFEQNNIKNRINSLDILIAKNHEELILELNRIKRDVLIHSDALEKMELDAKLINKSMIIDLDSIWAFFDSINIFKRIALSLLLLKGVVISSTFSLIFILYGDYLLTKYNIESRYPKLAKFIQLRRKFQRYYLVLAISWILLASFLEVLFCVSILSM